MKKYSGAFCFPLEVPLTFPLRMIGLRAKRSREDKIKVLDKLKAEYSEKGCIVD